MGIDAVLIGCVDRKVSSEELLSWSVGLASTLGREKFWISREKGRHVLSLVTSGPRSCYEQYAPIPRPETVFQVNQTWRYYGPGYNRGPWEYVAEVWNWFRYNVPEVTLMYAGDCGGGQELTPAFVAEMEQLFYTRGHRDYRGYNKEVTCGFCKTEMLAGWQNSAGWTTANCESCGFEVENPDNPKRF